MKSSVAAVCVAALILGCAAPQPPVVSTGAPFDPAEARRFLVEGPNIIRGSAFLRQQGGGVVTCAGRQVQLVPATAFAKRVFLAVYGTTEGQARHAGRNVRIEPVSTEYGKLTKEVLCDAQGAFSFDRVADGDYFVETTVTWVVGGVTNGGPVMRRVAVAGGSATSVVISP